MRVYYSTGPIDMMMKHIKRFVEECKLIELEKLDATNEQASQIICKKISRRERGSGVNCG